MITQMRGRARKLGRFYAREVEHLRERLGLWTHSPVDRRLATAPVLATASILLSVVAVSLLVHGLAGLPIAQASTSTATNANTSPKLPVSYVDSLLGFSLHLPAGWSAHPESVVFSRASAVERNALVSLHDPAHSGDVLEVAITESPAMSGAFSRLGAPDTRVGPYPALTRDIPVQPSDTASSTYGPCLVRIFLAQTSQRADYVVAQACGAALSAQAAAFESVIASYRPAAPKTGAAVRLAQRSVSADAVDSAAQPATCAQLVAKATARPTGVSNWGRELASATDPRWNPYPTPAASVCSNFYTVNGKLVGWDGYTFQCVELANRFLREQWGHGGVNGNAAQWFDYYQNGVRHNGLVRIYPDAQFSDDASQGISAFAPGPGDILVWQDVRDGKNWTSGLTNSPGHVAVITGTDATHVYFMQQNYNDVHYYMSLPLAKVVAGWKITDTVSGVPGRIVRGWIHFTPDTAAPGPAPASTPPATPTLSTTNAQDLYAIGANGQLYTYAASPTATANTSQTPQLARLTDDRNAPALSGTPSLNVYTLNGEQVQSVFATGANGHLYEYISSAGGGSGWTRNDLTILAPLANGVVVTGSPIAVTYTLPGLSLLHHSVYAAASDGKLYRWVWTEGESWQPPTALPSASSAAPIALSALSWASTAAAVATPTASNTAALLTRDEAVYALRADNHLYEYLTADGTSWQETDLSAATTTKTATAPLLTGIPSAYTFTPSGTQSGAASVQRMVFALGLDGHLYSFGLGASSSAPSSQGSQATSRAPAWTLTDVSTVATDGPKVGQSTAQSPSGSALSGVGFGFVGSPSAFYAPAVQQPSHTSHEVFVAGNDGHVYEYAYSDAWHATDLSAAAKAPATTFLTGSPFAFSFALTGDTASRRTVYVAAQNGTLAELAYGPTATSATPAWSFTASSGTEAAKLGSGLLTGATWTQQSAAASNPAPASGTKG